MHIWIMYVCMHASIAQWFICDAGEDSSVFVHKAHRLQGPPCYAYAYKPIHMHDTYAQATMATVPGLLQHPVAQCDCCLYTHIHACIHAYTDKHTHTHGLQTCNNTTFVATFSSMVSLLSSAHVHADRQAGRQAHTHTHTHNRDYKGKGIRCVGSSSSILSLCACIPIHTYIQTSHMHRLQGQRHHVCCFVQQRCISSVWHVRFSAVWLQLL